MQRAETVLDTLEGSMTLGEAVVRQAVQLAQQDPIHALQTAFARGLARDGYVWRGATMGKTLPFALHCRPKIQLPQTDDEVHQLLKSSGFATPLGHLDQAIEAHTGGDWAACNSQLRAFLESLFDDIARNVRPQEAAQRSSPENRRALLAEIGFLAADRNEWTQDGKNYVNGLRRSVRNQSTANAWPRPISMPAGAAEKKL